MYHVVMSSFENYFYQNIGDRIKKYRESQGYTQEELSELLGKNLKYIGHIERCERRVSTFMLMRILEIFKVAPSEFFEFEQQFSWED